MVLVCVTDQESCSRLIFAGRKLADLLETDLKVISVRPRSSGHWMASDELEYLFGVAKDLDAEMIVKFNNYPVDTVASYIDDHDVESVIVGTPPQFGQSVFISELESRFPDLPVICVDKTGRLQLAPVFQESNMDGADA